MDDGRRKWELAAEQLRKITVPASLGFETTASLAAPQRMLGQARAEEAMEFALGIQDARYNLYVSGEPGTGRFVALKACLDRVAHERPAAPDWCYVYNFEQPSEPKPLALPTGSGRAFAHDVETYVLGCRRELRRAFADAAYERQREGVLRALEARHAALLDELRRQALALGFLVQGTPSGLEALPVRQQPVAAAPAEGGAGVSEADGEPQPMTKEEFDALSEQEQAQLRTNNERVEEAIAHALPAIRATEEEARARVRRLDRAVAKKAIAHLTEQLAARYGAQQKTVDHLHQLEADIAAHADVLTGTDAENAPQGAADTALQPEQEQEEAAPEEDGSLGVAATDEGGQRSGAVPLDEGLRPRPSIATLLRRYRVNVLAHHSPEHGAPVVREINPTFRNLVGRIELGLRDGLPFADHMMIKPGAFHRANGGFLIVDASDLLSNSRSWDAIKRLLRFGTIVLESDAEQQNAPGGAALRPEAIPAHVKVIMIGDTATYGLLLNQDSEFRQLFKVRADFDRDMPRTAETEHFYAQEAAEAAQGAEGPALTSDAVALLVEQGSRWAEDQHRLSAQLDSVRDLAVEACYWARKEGSGRTERQHMVKAIAARERRLSLVSDKLDQMVFQGTMMIDTDGYAVGQLNGLTVISVGDHAFGKPVRITARTSPGWSGVVNMEREVEMSGASHSKGILILTGYLAGRFAQDFPLSLSASLCFEQMYDEVDGDSASSTELYAVLSSLAGAPMRQAIAVTGSVNQRGDVQAVGGVTQKIEGYFKICRTRGLTGEQGVIIPRANVRNLMLNEDVIEASRAGRFHIFSVSTIDEGIEILTGIPAGRPDPSGRYLEGTINARVNQALRAYSEKVRAYTGAPAGARLGG
jgi:predicted ATP-dependent protease